MISLLVFLGLKLGLKVQQRADRARHLINPNYIEFLLSFLSGRELGDLADIRDIQSILAEAAQRGRLLSLEDAFEVDKDSLLVLVVSVGIVSLVVGLPDLILREEARDLPEHLLDQSDGILSVGVSLEELDSPEKLPQEYQEIDQIQLVFFFFEILDDSVDAEQDQH